MDAPEPHVGMLVKRLSEALDRKANNQLRDLGLSLSQMRVLHDLEHVGDGSLTLRELEVSCGVSQPTMWGIVHRLQEKGLVEDEDMAGRRARRVRLSAAGRAMCAAGAHLMEDNERELLGTLADREVDELRGMLVRLLDGM